ncbi:MAG: helix-turn-helix transcriptional regulator [Methanobrevibacter sp.]|uniref:helix-turn-helix domain-containing protein n=1 Tax=Methanobrevibacter sp. TaxID=66852 RepID=UPI0025FE6A2B|nr:helix-turn-helix transcriptional regulator [Methanobrevibacter sp.]MBR0272130.1 helix-turn-helix transcriptional regulator [Methanobrevibacter sp.]
MEKNISRLKQLRKNHGFSQKQVSNYLGIDQSNLSKIERDKRNLNLDLLDKLCLLYNCSPEYILGESDEYNAPKIAFRIDKNVDLNVIAKINETMNYLKLLRELNEE